jgi:succinate dehydrogenase/fumarate reductase flavoprotein subunit
MISLNDYIAKLSPDQQKRIQERVHELLETNDVAIGDEVQIQVSKSDWEHYWTIRNEEDIAEAITLVNSDQEEFRIVRVSVVFPTL